MSARFIRVVCAVLLLSSLVLAVTRCTSSGSGAAPTAAAAPAAAPARAIPPPATLPAQGLAPIVSRVRPAIVTIRVRRPIEPSRLSPLWGLLPGMRGGGNFAPEEQGEGSGVIVGAGGTILTNRHVVDGASQVEVGLTDGRELAGKVIGIDEPTDIAVVQVDARDLPVVPLGDSSALQFGDYTLAIGTPFGLGQSVTFGIVSGIGRSGMGLADYEDFIQTDAAINPGNSGGALLDIHGRLIGINTAIIAHGMGGNQGVGLAVPVNLAVTVMRQLVAHGKVVRGFMGVGIQDLTAELAAGLHIDRPGGAIISDVQPGGPASKAGMRRGDVIISLDGKPVLDGHAVRVRVASSAPGTVAHLGLVRDRHPIEVSVKLGTLPVQEPARTAEAGQGPGGYGLELSDLDRALAGEIGVDPSISGAVIAEVEPNSPAAEAALQPGDVIEQIDGKRVPGAEGAVAALRAASLTPHVLLILRQRHTFFVPLSRRAG